MIAVPARNEEPTIAACLEAVAVAVARCGLPAVVVVAADSCTDRTAEVAAAVAERVALPLIVHRGRWHTAGRARNAAVDVGLAALGEIERTTTWIANTDADSVVEPLWLTRQVHHAESGAHAVAGIVRLDPSLTPPELIAAFDTAYGPTEVTHAHVHAANLGIRADAYDRAGGWSTTTVVGEDHALIRALTATNHSTVYATNVIVTTSSRTSGRMPAAFAHHLAKLTTPVTA